MSNDQKGNLRFIALSIADPARKALSASLIMHAADVFFQKEQSRFQTNVGNTYTYSCLYATEGLAVVEIAETIQNKKDPPEEKTTGLGERYHCRSWSVAKTSWSTTGT